MCWLNNNITGWRVPVSCHLPKVAIFTLQIQQSGFNIWIHQ